MPGWNVRLSLSLLCLRQIFTCFFPWIFMALDVISGCKWNEQIFLSAQLPVAPMFCGGGKREIGAETTQVTEFWTCRGNFLFTTCSFSFTQILVCWLTSFSAPRYGDFSSDRGAQSLRYLIWPRGGPPALDVQLSPLQNFLWSAGANYCFLQSYVGCCGVSWTQPFCVKTVVAAMVPIQIYLSAMQSCFLFPDCFCF